MHQSTATITTMLARCHARALFSNVGCKVEEKTRQRKEQGSVCRMTLHVSAFSILLPNVSVNYNCTYSVMFCLQAKCNKGIADVAMNYQDDASGNGDCFVFGRTGGNVYAHDESITCTLSFCRYLHGLYR